MTKNVTVSLFRPRGGGRNTRVRLNNNILVVDVLRDTPTPTGGGLITVKPTGGGLITVNLVINAEPTRLQRILSCVWSDPAIILDDVGNSIEVLMKGMADVNFVSFFVDGSDTSVFTEGDSARGVPVRLN